MIANTDPDYPRVVAEAEAEYASVRADLIKLFYAYDHAKGEEFWEAEEELYNYALDFSYIRPGTYNDQTEGFFRYQISTGGPGTEIRFYCSPNGPNWSLYRIEFWYLTWGNGYGIDVTIDGTMCRLFSDLDEQELFTYSYEKATE